MENLNEKKISITVFITSITLVIYINMIKEIIIIGGKKAQVFKLFGEDYSYNKTLLFLFLIIITAIILFVFTTDSAIKSFLKDLWIKASNKAKQIKSEIKKPIHQKADTFEKTAFENQEVKAEAELIPRFQLKSYLFKHNGRMNRKYYLLNIFVANILFYFLMILVSVFLKQFVQQFGYFPIFIYVIAYIVLFLILFLKVCAQRFQDIGYDGNYAYLCIIPGLNIIVGLYLLFAEGYQFPTIYGDPPK